MEYKKTSDGWILCNGRAEAGPFKKIGFIVDLNLFPGRDPILIKHGELAFIEKHCKAMKAAFVDNPLMEVNPEIMETAKEIAASLLLVDASDWTVQDVNDSLDVINHIKKVLIKKGLIEEDLFIKSI